MQNTLCPIKIHCWALQLENVLPSTTIFWQQCSLMCRIFFLAILVSDSRTHCMYSLLLLSINSVYQYWNYIDSVLVLCNAPRLLCTEIRHLGNATAVTDYRKVYKADGGITQIWKHSWMNGRNSCHVPTPSTHYQATQSLCKAYVAFYRWPSALHTLKAVATLFNNNRLYRYQQICSSKHHPLPGSRTAFNPSHFWALLMENWGRISGNAQKRSDRLSWDHVHLTCGTLAENTFLTFLQYFRVNKLVWITLWTGIVSKESTFSSFPFLISQATYSHEVLECILGKTINFFLSAILT